MNGQRLPIALTGSAAMPFDRVIRVVPNSLVERSVPWPFQVSGVSGALTVKISGIPSFNYIYPRVMRVSLQAGGKDIPDGSSITGTLNAGSIVNIDGFPYETSKDLTFGGGSVIFGDAASDSVFNTNFRYFIWTNWILAGTDSDAIRIADYISSADGLRAIGTIISNGSNTVTGGTISAPGWRLRNFIRNLPLSELPHTRAYEFLDRSRNPLIKDSVPAIPTQELIGIRDIGAIIGSGHGFLELAKHVQGEFSEEIPVTLASEASFDASGGIRVWAELDDYSIADSVNSQDELTAVELSAFLVRSNFDIDNEGLIVDDNDSVWFIRGVETVRKGLYRIQCQRDVTRANNSNFARRIQ